MAMKSGYVTRAALGRPAKLGELYDIRTESFLNDTLFASGIVDEMKDTMDLGETAIELVTSDSLEEKCHMLDVEAGLYVSLMAGMVKLNGSGSYLAEERKSTRAQSMGLIYKLITVNEEVMVRQNIKKIDLDVLSGPTTDATHVVVAIDWGAICSITCEYENFENKDCSEVKGSLKAEIEMLKGLVDGQGSAKVTYEDRENKQHNKFTFKCKADVSAPDSDLPVTFEGAVELVRNLPSLVKKTNDGKGVPLTYHLMPLEAVNKMCKSRKTLNVLYKEINAGTVKKCADVLTRITQKRQKLYDIHHDMHANAAFVPDQSVEAIDGIFGEETVRESRFRAELQQLVTSVRSGSTDVCELEKFLGEHEPEKILSEHCAAISGFQKDLNEVSMIKSWRAKGIRYLGKKDVLKLDEKPHVVVLYKMTRSNDTSNLDKNQDFFFRLQVTHAAEDGYQFIIVDRELSEQYWPSGVTNPVIHKYHKGSLVCEDLYVKEGQDMEMCLIEPAQPVYCQFRTKNRAYVCLRCPKAAAGSGLCTGDPVNWRCSKCKDLVEYGIDTEKFYCRCGESVPVESRFRCNDKNHSTMFVSYPSDILNAELSQHRAMKEFNILILGETGVGKSTWINSFQNYLYFHDLYEAMKSPEFHVLIPSSFTLTQAGEEKLIQIGEQDSNEVMETGTSATKEPRSYVFYVGGARIRFIDTPGIGDSEGIEQDHKNVDNILSYLTYYDEIHAVCILLKPNNARLTAMFRFCIQELLVQLHSSAKDNIVFCFTNTRTTFYQPGDTLPALNIELRSREVGIQATPHNYFCFDNEPFRFLACMKNGVQFSHADIDTYAKSWDKSVVETKRLFEYINAELKPHKVRETLSMNEARRIIVAMSKPLAEVARTIDLNVQSAQRAKEQIELADSDIRSLEKNLKFAGYDIERVELGYPRIVCTAPSCIVFVQVGTDKVQNTVYKQICHSHCYLEGIPTQTTNNPKLRGYRFVGPRENCLNCGHHYTVHMYLTYDTKVFDKEFLPESVQKEIQKKGSAKTQKEAAKSVIDNTITELQKEEKDIMETSAKYGSFLKANALIPYNDAVGDYLDMCIEQEKWKPNEFRNTALLSKMQEMKYEYERQRATLDQAIGTGVGENIRTPKQVTEQLRELFQLKHFGLTLKKLFDGISITNSARNVSFGEKIVPVSPKYTHRWKSWKTASSASVPVVDSSQTAKPSTVTHRGDKASSASVPVVDSSQAAKPSTVTHRGDKDRPTEILCEGVFDRMGGEMTIASHTLRIPEGALKEDTRITLKVFQDVPDFVHLRDDEAIATYCFQCFPSGLSFAKGKPVKLTVPHCFNLSDPPKIGTVLYYWCHDENEQNGQVRLERIVLTSKTCRVTPDNIEIFLEHFSGGILTFIKSWWNMNWKLMSFMPFLPRTLPPTGKVLMELRMVNKPRNTSWTMVHRYHKNAKYQPAKEDDDEMLVKGKELQISCQIEDNTAVIKKVPSDLLSTTAKQTAYFDLNLEDTSDDSLVKLEVQQGGTVMNIQFMTRFSDGAAEEADDYYDDEDGDSRGGPARNEAQVSSVRRRGNDPTSIKLETSTETKDGNKSAMTFTVSEVGREHIILLSVALAVGAGLFFLNRHKN